MTETGKKEKMNLPNKLTIIRVVMILPFVVLLLGSHEGWGWFQAIFGFSSRCPRVLTKKLVNPLFGLCYDSAITLLQNC